MPAEAVGGRANGRLRCHHDFQLLWAGQSVSDLGTAVTTVVLPLVMVVYLRASAFEVGALAAAQWMPWLLVGLPAGAWVDRVRCRGLMISCDALRAVALCSVPVASAAGVLTVGQVFAVALLTGFATVFFQVAYFSYLPSLIDRADLAEGNAKLQVTQSAAAVAGPGLGGILARLFMAPFAVVADSASYVVSALALAMIRAREPARQATAGERSLRREIGQGLRCIRTDPLLRVLTAAPALANFFFAGAEALYVLFLVRAAHLATATAGVLIGLSGLGSVVGAVIAPRLAKRIGNSRTLWLILVVTAPFGLLVPLTEPGLAAAFFIVGNIVVCGGIVTYNITVASFRQKYCPSAILGRITATTRFALCGAIPLGAVVSGTLAEALGSRTALWVMLAGNLLPGFILAASPVGRMRDLPESPDSPALIAASGLAVESPGAG